MKNLGTLKVITKTIFVIICAVCLLAFSWLLNAVLCWVVAWLLGKTVTIKIVTAIWIIVTYIRVELRQAIKAANEK